MIVGIAANNHSHHYFLTTRLSARRFVLAYTLKYFQLKECLSTCTQVHASTIHLQLAIFVMYPYLRV